jgi:hypothetical protein
VLYTKAPETDYMVRSLFLFFPNPDRNLSSNRINPRAGL